MANFTEKAIRQAFLGLLNERPLNKITVKDITDRCGINRNSFYYHYQDIPSLIQEILKGEINRIIEEYPELTSFEDCAMVAAGFSLENRRAIMHIYNSVNRDMFEQYLWQVCEHTVKAYFGNAFPHAKLSEKDRHILLRYYQCELFGIILGWLQTGMKDDIKPFISRLCEIRTGQWEAMVSFCENNEENL